MSAFVTSDGLYQYKVMPFGMKNSAMTFRFTSNMDNCQVYLETPWMQKLTKLAHGVFLGHVVGQGEVKPIKGHVEGNDIFPVRSDKK